MLAKWTFRRRLMMPENSNNASIIQWCHDRPVLTLRRRPFSGRRLPKGLLNNVSSQARSGSARKSANQQTAVC